MNEEQSFFDDRFRIDQKGTDDAPRSENVRYSQRKTNGNNNIKIIAVGAVFITFLVVMLYLLLTNPSVESTPERAEGKASDNNQTTISLLEKRLGKLEITLAEISEKISTTRTDTAGSGADMYVLTGRVERAENALSTKFNIVSDNIDKLEVQVAGVVNRVKDLEKNGGGRSPAQQVSPSLVSSGKTTQKSAGAATASSVKLTAKGTKTQVSHKTALKKPPTKTILEEPSTKIILEEPPTKTILGKPPTKTTKEATSTLLYHVIQKGDTFYSISRKYGTTVAHILKLNHFSKQPILYPGNKLIVK